MIVIARNLIPGPTEASLPPGTPWIGWHNIVTPAKLSSTTAAAGFPVTNLANPSTNLLWTGGANTGDEFVTLTTQTTDPIDYLAVATHNFGTNGNVVSVEGRFDDGNSPPEPYVELVQQQILPTNSPVIFRFTPQMLTHVRLRIVQGTAAPQAAVLYVGKLLLMERGVKIETDHVPINYGRKSKVYSGFSEEGNFLGRVVLQQHRESKAEFAHITPTWYRAYLDPFIAVSKTTPFFYAWDPDEYPLETGYAWMVNDPMPATSPVTRRVAITLDMRGVV